MNSPFLKTLLLLVSSVLYANTVNAQIQLGGDIDGEAYNDQSGSSVSMPDAYTVAIGARYSYGNGAHSGQVRIYKWIGSAWIQKGDDIDGEAPLD